LGEEFTRRDIFLDRQRKIPAPKSDTEKEIFKGEVKILIARYEKQLSSYEINEGFKEVSPSHSMGQKLAKGYVSEYRQIYAKHFRSNAISFILDDWIKCD